MPVKALRKSEKITPFFPGREVGYAASHRGRNGELEFVE
jgi:hypothetical protein